MAGREADRPRKGKIGRPAVELHTRLHYTRAMQTRAQMLRLAVLTVMASAASAADLTIHHKTTVTGASSRSQAGTQYWTATKMVTDEPATRSIIDMSAQTMTFMDKQKKTYFVQTFEELHRRVDELHAQLQEQLKSLPPEEGGEAATVVNPTLALDLQPTGERTQIAGYEAAEYDIAGDPSVTGSVWVTDAFKPPVAAGALERFAKAMAGLGGPGGRLAQALAKLNGLVLRSTITTLVKEQTATTTTEVTKIETTPPPIDVLAVPAGYSQITTAQ
jgi:hypothetical protein